MWMRSSFQILNWRPRRVKLIQALGSGAGSLGNRSKAAHAWTLLSWPLRPAYKREPPGSHEGGQTDTSTIHIHPHPAAISITVLHSALHQFAGRSSRSAMTTAARLSPSRTRCRRANSAACGRVTTSASQCHATNIVAIEEDDHCSLIGGVL